MICTFFGLQRYHIVLESNIAALIEKKKRKTKKNQIKTYSNSQAQIKHAQDAACNVQAGMPWQHMERFTDRIIATDLIA